MRPGSSDPDPDPQPFALTVTESTDHAPLTLGLQVDASPAAEVTVDYWTEGEPRLRITSPAADAHALLLVRLLAERTYQYEVRAAFVGDSAYADTLAGEFTTDTLPDLLDAVTLTSTGASTPPLTMLELRQPTFQGFAAVDATGRVVWFHPTGGASWGWTRRANGNFVFLDTRDGLNEVTPAREPVASLAAAQGELIHHDVIATPQNTLYFMSRHQQSFEGIPWTGEIIWEWDPQDGAPLERWNSFDHLSPATDTTSRSHPGDWIHGNSLDLGPDGLVLLSSPFLNQVIAIEPDFSAIAWRLGGANATIATDSAGTFDFQHTAAQLAADRVLVFDNRGGREGPLEYSRALELEIDFDADTAREVWSFRAPNDNYAPIISGARRLANGNTMVTFGLRHDFRGSRGPIEVYEVDPAGTVVWHLVVDGPDLMYRATPFEAIADEVVVEAPAP
ncbi:MAG TPA: aryl-sulfate sulfotransferase [Longimicrobiales bacterium]|nr:aryl-sulfate sulfotransferase [Longimicrobiales bacterium]